MAVLSQTIERLLLQELGPDGKGRADTLQKLMDDVRTLLARHTLSLAYKIDLPHSNSNTDSYNMAIYVKILIRVLVDKGSKFNSMPTVKLHACVHPSS